MGLRAGSHFRLGIKKLIHVYYKYCILQLQAHVLVGDSAEEPPCYETVHRTRGVPIIRLGIRQIHRFFADEKRRSRKFAYSIL